MNHHINIVRIKAVANALNALKEKVVFVGGATVSLYANRPVLEIRITDDVDVLIEILNYKKRTQLERKLSDIGFLNDVESGIICRYKIQGIIVDIMPTEGTYVGFSNIWYPEGFENSVDYKIDDNCTIKILKIPYFIATKLEAFKGRGKNDGRTSQDFEDIVFVLENRENIWQELFKTEGNIKTYLKNEFTELLNKRYLHEWIDCHVERASLPATNLIIDEMKKFISKVNGV
jgi:predicted nucleotidyltransferase